MSMKARCLCLSAFCLGWAMIVLVSIPAIVASSSAQSPALESREITGRVTNESGEPLSNALVSAVPVMEKEADRLPFTTITDDDHDGGMLDFAAQLQGTEHRTA